MESELIRSVVATLRYRPCEHIIGRSIEIGNLRLVEEALRAALGDDFPTGCHLEGSELAARERIVARDGILDLRFSAPDGMLNENARMGVYLLRDLGFLPGGDIGPRHRVCDDPTCLEMLQDELAAGRTYLLFLLEASGTSPRGFRIADACVTNASLVWMWKHFYP